MSNVTFNNCNFENCNINITEINSGNCGGSESMNPVASLMVFGGIAMALNPALIGTVVGVALLGAKGLAIGGIGYSTIKTLSILKDSKKEQNLLEIKKMDYIETTYKVKELE